MAIRWHSIFTLFSVALTLLAASVFAQDTAYVPFKVNVNATVKAQQGTESVSINVTANIIDTLHFVSEIPSALASPDRTQKPVDAEISLYSLNGKRVLHDRVSASEAMKNISYPNIATGVYVLHVNESGNIFSTLLAHQGGGMNIDVSFGGTSPLKKDGSAAFGIWDITVSAEGYSDSTYTLKPVKGINELQNITLNPLSSSSVETPSSSSFVEMPPSSSSVEMPSSSSSVETPSSSSSVETLPSSSSVETLTSSSSAQTNSSSSSAQTTPSSSSAQTNSSSSSAQTTPSSSSAQTTPSSSSAQTIPSSSSAQTNSSSSSAQTNSSSSSAQTPPSSSSVETLSSSSSVEMPSSSSSVETPSSSSSVETPPSSSSADNSIAARDFIFDDIQYWVGEGENRAMLIIQWDDGKNPEAWAWGYRWSGTKSGEDIINDIIKADGRLFWLQFYSGPDLGTAIAGFGFDARGSDNAKLSNGTVPCQSPVNGTVYTYAYDFDDWELCDGNDASARFAAGWYDKGYWSYWVTDVVNGKWEYSGLGASSRVLSNNSVDAWFFDVNAFSDYENSTFYRCMLNEDECDGARDYFGNITPISKPR